MCKLIITDKNEINNEEFTNVEMVNMEGKMYKAIFISIITSILATIFFINLFDTSLSFNDYINRVENDMDSLNSSYNELYDSYNSLVDQYNILLSKYNVVQDQLIEATNTINSLYNDLDEATDYINTSIAAPSTKQYSSNSDLSLTEIITEERMNRIIDYWLDRNNKSESPFRNQGKAFIKASQESNLDPLFIFAIASHESGFGTSNIAKTKNNYMGIGAFDSSPYASALHMGSCFEDGIVANAKWVADNYYNKGQTTLSKMIYGGKCYSSSKDHWINSISSIMIKSSTIN